MAYASVQDLTTLWRPMTADEQARATALLDVVSSELKVKAKRCGKDLDTMAADADYLAVLKSVVCDVVARCLMTSTDSEPMTQMSQAAGGYSVSGSFLVPGGGLFIKKSEFSRLGLRNQVWGGLNAYNA